MYILTFSFVLFYLFLLFRKFFGFVERVPASRRITLPPASHRCGQRRPTESWSDAASTSSDTRRRRYNHGRKRHSLDKQSATNPHRQICNLQADCEPESNYLIQSKSQCNKSAQIQKRKLPYYAEKLLLWFFKWGNEKFQYWHEPILGLVDDRFFNHP